MAFAVRHRTSSRERGELTIAHHGLELPLLFGRPELTGGGEEAERVCQQLIAAWSSFMRGEPRAPDGSVWPCYEATRRATLRVDVNCSIVDAPLERQRAAWSVLPHAWHDASHGTSGEPESRGSA